VKLIGAGGEVEMKRRNFILSLGSVLLSGMWNLKHSTSLALEEQRPKIPRRKLGRTGFEVSIIGLSGLAFNRLEQDTANKLVKEAIDAGINFVDVAPAYGNAEEVLGVALEGYRDKIVLACKTGRRTKEEAMQELLRSLKRLRTDHFDLYQLHALTKMEELDVALGKGGAIETLIEAREKGLVRFLGFSAHSLKVALEAMRRFDFDTVMFPINFVTWYRENFGPQVIELAKEKGMGCIAIKAMVKGALQPKQERPYPRLWYLPTDQYEEASMALRWTLSQGVSVAMPPSDERLVRLAIKIASEYKPITDEEVEKLRTLAQNYTPLFKSDI
jgi:aryl-alcohol dehydrogenase-like predicted oxidoreductase